MTYPRQQFLGSTGAETMKMNPIAPEVNRQVTPVGISIEQLEKEIHHLREAVFQLNDRLLVVMRPIPANDNGSKPSNSGNSPLVNQVDALAQLVRSTSADVFAMLDCLEL
jgi:hypothetical protein